MLKAAATFVLALSVAACATGPQNPRDRIERTLAHAPGAAQPGEVVAAELAFARAAQDKGQWTAFREFAAEDAVMFVPEPVKARDWLKQQTDPPAAVKWQPHAVWMSCDGTLAVTRGAWQRPDGTFGWFTTVWMRQKEDKSYRWILDQGDALKTPLAEPDFIASKVAFCPKPGSPPPLTVLDMAGQTQRGEGWSRDNTLRYRWSLGEDGTRRFVVSLRTPDGMEDVLTTSVAGGS